MPEGPSRRRTQVRLAGKTVRKDGTVSHVRYSKKVTHEICLRLAQGEVWAQDL